MTLPQGEFDVLVFAGALDDGYRWGESNVTGLTIEVPEHPPVRLALDTETSVRGYWSDGTADVDLTPALRNEGYREFEDAKRVAVTCLKGGKAIKDCGGESSVSLTDGFGPAAAETLTMRVPAGAVSFRIDYGGDQPAIVEMDVPQRILGVDRDVWACFSDRPGIYADEEGCGGWYPETIVKWDQDTVKVWATGIKDYIEVLEDVLDELSPLLNLEFEWVESKEEADLEAHVGVTIAEAIAVDVYCEHSGGCANSQHHLGVVTSAWIGVWTYESEGWSDLGLLDKVIRDTIMHEALHALALMNHRTHLSSIMARGLNLAMLSPMDEALVRLNSHPLVKPGMTMAEVEELILFGDELLDPQQSKKPSAYEMVHSAYVALQEAGSARFRMRGSWRGSGSDSKFGWADYEIARFRQSYADLVHFDDGADHFYIINTVDDAGSNEYWSELSRRWRQIESDEFFDNTHWRNGLSSPHRMLASILFFADRGDIEVLQSSKGEVKLRVELDDAYISLTWSRSERLIATLVLDEETFEIREYEMMWRFRPYGSSCPRYDMEATDGEYGIEIGFPDAILEGSENISQGDDES